MTKEEKLQEDIDKAFYNIPLDENVKEIERRIKVILEEYLYTCKYEDKKYEE
jgi:hypothetical protein